MNVTKYINRVKISHLLGESTNQSKNGDWYELIGYILQDRAFTARFEKALKLTFIPGEKRGNLCFAYNDDLRDDFREVFTPGHLLNYIFAMVHANNGTNYQTNIQPADLQDIPITEDSGKFWELVRMGSELRETFQLDSKALKQFPVSFPIAGNNIVNNPHFLEEVQNKPTDHTPHSDIVNNVVAGRIFINEIQYFDHAEKIAWNYKTGTIQPAQLWLTDRLKRALTTDEIGHYKKLLAALMAANKLIMGRLHV